MASTTRTCTYAQAGAQAMANTFGNRVVGQATVGSLSASGSGILLVCKLPVGARHIRIGFSALHTGATGAKLQFGVQRDGSVTASALLSLTDIAVTNQLAWTVGPTSYSPNWDTHTNSTGASFVTCTVGSGTVSAGFVLDYEVTYDFQT